MSLPPEVLKKVKLLEISTRKLVNNLFAGEYHTAFKGQGMTFADFREYVPGDDVRSISWPLTARTGKTFIKTFEEERELTLIIAVDVSGSSDFGTGPYFKGEVMTHMAALLAFSAVKNNDQIGLLLFSDQVEHYVPPKKGRGHVHRLLRDLFYFKPKSNETKLSTSLSYLQGVLKKRATIFLFSDFIDDNFEQPLRMLGRKHDVVACVVNDAAEYDLPNMGVVDMQDAETGEIITVDTSSASLREEYQKAVLKRKDQRDRQLRLAQVGRVDVKSSEDYVNPLVAFFKEEKIMTTAQCKVEIPNVDGLKENELTVGRDFLLTCEGEFPKDLVQDKLHFVLKPEQKYILKLKSFEFRSPTAVDLKVVSYTAGQVQFQQLQLTDETTTLELGSVGFNVQTVLEQPQPSQTGEAPKKPEPYGPIGPAQIGIPQSYWIALAVVLVLLISWVSAKIYRFIQRRRILEDLKKHDSALSPLAEFYAGLRKLQRYNTVFFGGEGTAEDITASVTELQRMFRLYLTRQFKIPALEWGPRLIVKDLKQHHSRVYTEEGLETQKLLNEFLKAQQAKNKVKTSDVLNLSKRARLLIEGMEKQL